MDENSKKELIGRLWLWADSIVRTQGLLQLAFRANVGKYQESQKEEMDNYIKKLNEFVHAQPESKPGTIFSSQQIAFDQIFHRPFPTQIECAGIYDACIELAIMYFCQIFNSGYGNNGEAARNDKNFVNEHFNSILTNAFETKDELEKFEQIKEKILTARDKMIGHSDADSYSIHHGHPISVKKSTRSWRDIDIELWSSFLDKVIIEIHNYSNRIKLSDNTITGLNSNT